MISSDAIFMMKLASRMPRPEWVPPPTFTMSVSSGDDPHFLERHAEPFVDQLREARLVALTVRHRADDDVDPAVALDGDFGAFARLPGGGVDIVGDGDAAVFAALARFGAARGEAVPVALSSAQSMTS